MSNKKEIIFLSVLCFFILSFLSTYATELIKGDIETENQSFSFPIKEHAMSFSGAYFYVGAAPDQQDKKIAKKFALSRVFRRTRFFEPLTPEKVTLNAQRDMPNPLFDAGISFFELLEQVEQKHGFSEHPVVVTAKNPSNVYLIDLISDLNNMFVQSIENLPDANGKKTAGIVGLTAGTKAFVFAAVRPEQGEFGDSGSGIDAMIFGFPPRLSEDEPQMRRFFLIDAQNGGVVSNEPKAVALDRDSAIVKINQELSSLSVADMQWHKNINCLYIALQGTSGSQNDAGIRALVVGRLNEENKLILKKVVPDTVFDGSNAQIIGALGNDKSVVLHKIRPLFTSSALSYLIVLGGVNVLGQTQRMVFALPLVNGNQNQELNGTIADKNAVADDFFGPLVAPESFLFRGIKKPAENPEQMVRADDMFALVGGGFLPAGDVSDLFVRNDTVFVVVNQPAEGQLPGIYSSQVLFDEQGKIKAWTQWTRAAGSVEELFGANLDPAMGNYIFMAENDENKVQIVKRTLWSEGAENGLLPLTQLIEKELPLPIGGVLGFRDFRQTSAGLRDISLLVTTGNNKIIITQTGEVNNDVLMPFLGQSLKPAISFSDGTITQNFPLPENNPAHIILAGGVLSQLGPIATSEIGISTTAQSGYLFVGGTNGVAVVADDQGLGWDTTSGLGPQFAGLRTGMRFHLFGEYTFVQKLVSDEQYLYVLTDKTLDRIDLNEVDFSIGQLHAVTIANVANIPFLRSDDVFFDLIISEQLALLATSKGIIRVGNGKDARVVSDSQDAQWKIVAVPEGIGPSQQFFAFTPFYKDNDIANFGGYFYLLSYYQGKNQAVLNRFLVNKLTNGGITDITIVPFPDFFVKNIQSYFVRYGELRNNFATDGALYLSSYDKTESNEIFVSVLPSIVNEPQTGQRFLGISNQPIAISFGQGTCISSIIRISPSGSWLISGHFGLRVNE